MLVIGSATALAAAVLVFTLLIEAPPYEAPRPQAIDDPLDPALIGQFDPDQLSGDLDPRGQVEKYRVNSHNSKGQLIELFGDSLSPQPFGVTQVKNPGARIHLTGSRVLEMLAEEGKIVAPDNEPRSGDFSGRVALSLFESPPGRAPQISEDSDDLKLRVDLTDARFDMELGQIESHGPVHLTSRRVDFRGTGLNLLYNDRQRHLDRLVVDRGRSLRFKPSDLKGDLSLATNAAATDGTVAASQPSPDPSPPPPRSPGPRGDDSRDETLSLPPTTPTEPPRFYRARFEDHVVIRARDASIEADRLEVVFSLDAKPVNDGDGLLKQISSRVLKPGRGFGHVPDLKPAIVTTSSREAAGDRPFEASPLPHGRGSLSRMGDAHVNEVFIWPSPPVGAPSLWLASLSMALTAQGPAGGADLASDRSLIAHDADDVIITWSGRLVIEPEDSPPIDLAGPEDLLIQLVGRPVRMKTPRGQLVLAASAEYTSSEGRLRMIGSVNQPLRVESPQLGVLTGRRLEFDRSRGFGVVLGPGRLIGSVAGIDESPAGSSGSQAQSLRRGSITWNDRMELTLFPWEDDSDQVDPPKSLHAVQEAVFRGVVGVRHPQFDVTSDQLVVRFKPPVGGSQVLEDVLATGDVKITSGPNDLEVTSGSLSIEMTDDPSSGGGGAFSFHPHRAGPS